VLALLATLLSSCLNDSDDNPTSTAEGASFPLASTPTVPVTAAATAEPTTALPTWFESIIAPGPLLTVPERVFFVNGPDLWSLEADGSVSQITRQLRVAAAAGAPDGTRAAVLVRTEIGTRSAEEIRLVTAQGDVGEPFYGPELSEGPGSSAPVETLVWRPDGLALALVHADGLVRWLPVDGESDLRAPTDLLNLDEIVSIDEALWAPTGAGLVALARDDDGAGHLYAVSSNGERAMLGRDLEAVPSIGVFDWLPGRGRLVIVEDRAVGPNSLAGSIFSVAPDGSGRELLVSGGGFAPVVDVLRMQASPDGQWLAFTVYLPDAEGEPSFLSLWLLEIESGGLIEVAVPATFRVTDLWWSTAGLVWRGVDRDAPAPLGEERYGGSEPFVIAITTTDGGSSRVVFQSDER
jgi:hypothetical protein